ncbi:MAG: hypothetical protein WB608_22535 [Terracidiphilus sp.]
MNATSNEDREIGLTTDVDGSVETSLVPESLEITGPFPWLVQQQQWTRSWLRDKVGVDKAIGFTILARGWASLAGLVTVALISRFLSPAEQGYYYTFGSLIALQIVFELGFSFVILQMASHERAHLEFHPDGHVSGNPVAYGRLSSVLQKTVRWYSVASVLLAISLVLAGLYFFSQHQHAGELVDWRSPWYAAALLSALAFLLDPVISFMEGCGFVANVARLRFAQATTGSLLAWSALSVHEGLFAPAMVIAANAGIGAVWLFRRRRLLLPLLRHAPDEHKIHWFKEVWPFQWRMAISWLCGYFIFQLYNPVLFAFKGAVVAGQMGMSLSIATALQSVSISWINTKASPFGALIARGEYAQLDKLFFRALRQSLTVCASAAALVWCAALYLERSNPRFAHRILSPVPLALLFAGTFINVLVFAQALYLRAHKQEKFLLNSIVSAALMSCSTYFLGKYFGSTGMVIGALTIGIVFGLPLGTYTFFKYRREWHGE